MNGVQILERIGRTHHIAKLPVHLPLNTGDVEEHVHPRIKNKPLVLRSL